MVLLAIAYYFLLFNPLRQEYLARYDERALKEAREAELERTIAQLENVRRDVPDIERQILEYSKRLPTEDEIPTLVVQIEEIAEEADVTQLSIQPDSPEAPPGGGDFSRIPITMSFEGTYEELQDFLLRLRNLTRLVTVNEVTYEEARQGETAAVRRGGEDLLTVELLAETYVQPAAGGATVPADEGKAKSKAGESKAGESKAGESKAGESKASKS